MKRVNNRRPEQIRFIKISRNYLKYPEGSVLIEMGDTKVVCSASVEEHVPHFKKNTGLGWVTAEYSMLPRATSRRTPRESHGRVRGRTQEIQRLIGRSLRSVVDFSLLGERTIVIDTDVIQADGGTRTASITGAFVALYDAIKKLQKEKIIEKNPIKEFLAAVSVGILEGKVYVDLDYNEDSQADVDMNVVMTESGKMVEVQGTAEGEAFTRKEMDLMMDKAELGIKALIKKQKEVLKK